MSQSSAVTPARTATQVRVALDLSGVWTELTDPAQTTTVERIRAADLREAQQGAARVRAEATASGMDSSEIAVFLDIEIHIADDARTARREFSALDAATVPTSIRYVGTPSGLAGLVADVKAAEVADGVTLIAIGPEGRNFRKVADGVVPWLEDRGVAFSADAVLAATGALPASRVLAS